MEGNAAAGAENRRAGEKEDPAQEAEQEQTEFTFDQLDDRAKERAREAWRQADLAEEWWDATYEDAIRIGELIGIEVGQRDYKTVSGKTRQEPDIYFSLYVQGSGACFSGTLHIARLNGAAERLAAEIGTSSDGDQSLHDLAAIAQALYHQILLRAFTRRLRGPMAPDPDQPWGELSEIAITDTVKIKGDDSYYRTCVDADEDRPEEIEQAMNDYLAAFASWLHGQLEAECDYLYSDEVVDDAIRLACDDSGLLFDEFGSTI